MRDVIMKLWTKSKYREIVSDYYRAIDKAKKEVIEYEHGKEVTESKSDLCSERRSTGENL